MSWSWNKKGAAPPTAAPTPISSASPCALLKPFMQRVRRVSTCSHLLLVGELCGANITFLGERGFRVSVQKDLSSTGALLLDEFAGVLLWDSLSYIDPREARDWIRSLAATVATGGAVLAFFKGPSVTGVFPKSRYRILSEDRIRAEPSGDRLMRPQPYQNRDILRLFEGFELDQLHTHKDGQRESLFYRKSSGPA